MALIFGVSWLYALLLWGCICFLPQKGYNFAHGYSLNDGEFSSNAGVLGPQTSNQFHSGASLHTNQDSDSPKEEMQGMRHQSFVSTHAEPVHHENNEDASFVTGLSEEMVQSKPDSEHDAPSAAPVHKNEGDGSGIKHPFGLLVKGHSQKKPMKGGSFSSMKDLKGFIETMKNSYLIPGSDLSNHFQTARKTMENEMARNDEPDAGYRSNSAEEGTAHDDASENEPWSTGMNTAFEQNQQGANYQMPSEHPSDPVDSTASLISTSVYDSQDSGSALSPRHLLAATEHVSSNYGSLDSGGISGENLDISSSVQSISYELPEQIPSSSFFGEDLSFSGHVTVSPVNPQISPSQDFSDYSSETSNITPRTPEKNIHQPKYTSQSEDSLPEYQKPSGGLELGEDFQSEELGRVTPANELSAPMPRSLNSYGNNLYVSAPRDQLYIPDYLPKSPQAYQPAFGKESKDVKYPATSHLPVSTAVSSSSEHPSPQSSSHVGVQTSSPHDAQNKAFNRKQPVRFSLMFTVKPYGSLHGSSTRDGSLGDQLVSIGRPSALVAQTKDDEKPDLSKQNLVSANRGQKQIADNTLIPISSSLDSTQSGISSQVRVGDANFNTLTNLAPSSASERDFSQVGNEIMSRNFGIENIISDKGGARIPLSSFSTPLRRGISLNDGYESATRAGLLKTIIQPTRVWKHPDNMIMGYRPLKQHAASKVSAPTFNNVWGIRWNKKRLPPQTGPNMSPPSVNAYVVKSRSGYVRVKESLSKARYAPYQLDQYKNTVSHNVKGIQQ